MRIDYHFDLDSNGNVFATHFIETEPGKHPQIAHPALGPEPAHVIHYIKALHDGTIPIAGTGWDEPANHPHHPGKTKLEVLKGEIVRLNDAPARAILGV